MANPINIKEFVEKEMEELRDYFQRLNEKYPNMATKVVFVRVGNDPASISYMKSKTDIIESTGVLHVEDIIIDIDETLSNEEKANKIKNDLDNIRFELNCDDSVFGYLIQSPVPYLSQQDYYNISSVISEEKDIDGFSIKWRDTQWNGLPNKNNKNDIFIEAYPCTPLGILYYLKKTNYDLAGKNVVVVGRSDIVGKPLIMGLINSGASVKVFSSTTPIDEINSYISYPVNKINVLIVAIGKPELIKITGEYGCNHIDYIFDVGINRIKDETKKSGYRLVGDISEESINKFMTETTNYTKVPGGVGLLTRLGLLIRLKALTYI